MKRRPDEGVSEAQLEMMREWEAAILAVAREEMAHLGTVSNLLTAVAGAANFQRPNFPIANRHFPRPRERQNRVRRVLADALLACDR
jgi:rubrerythrin